MDFSHLRAQASVTDDLVECPIYSLEGTPVLLVKIATEENPAYWSAAFRSEKQLARMSRGGVGPELLRMRRDEDRKAYAAHVVKGWRGVLDAQGKEVPFSQEACRAFLDKEHGIPDVVFDEVRAFCNDRANFRAVVDAEAVGNG